MTAPNKIRLSYSKLNSFVNAQKYGRSKLEVVQRDILGELPPLPTTPAMELGTLAHCIIEEEKLDLEGLGEGGDYEQKYVVNLFDWLDFSFIADRVKDGVLVDYKTGKGDPLQLYVYAFLLALLDVDIHEGRLVYVNCESKGRQVSKRSQRKYPITKKELKMAWSWIDETSHEIKDMLDNLKNYEW